MSQTGKHIILLLLLLMNGSTIWAQNSDYDLIKTGNKDYRQKYYRDAETNYQKAANQRATFESFYNLGNAMLMQGQDSVALTNFMRADSLASPNKRKMAAVRHNIGNEYFAQASGKLQQNDKAKALEFFTLAANAYKASLRKNPKDDETRHNLAKAQYWMKKLQEEQQQNQQNKEQNKDKQNQQNQDKQNQNQQNKDDKNKDKQDKDKQDKDKQDQDKKDQQDKDKEKDQDKKDQDKDQQNKDQNQQSKDQQKNQQDQQQNGQKQPGQPREGQIDQETAKKLLDAAQQDEKRIQRRLQEQNKDPRNARGIRKRKDW